LRFDACLIIPGQHGFRGFDLLCDTRRSGFDVNYGGVIGIHQAVLNGNFLFDFRTSTLSIDRTALLGKVLVDFVPHGSQECGERPVSRLAGSRRLKMLFSSSILATLLSAPPAPSSKFAPLCTHFIPPAPAAS
jgi:hypothetical protein